MAKQKSRLKYCGSLFWLIFWFIIFFPIAIVLLVTQLKIISSSKTVYYEYEGATFWLYFWAIFFFPIMVLLFFLNGSFVKVVK